MTVPSPTQNVETHGQDCVVKRIPPVSYVKTTSLFHTDLFVVLPIHPTFTKTKIVVVKMISSELRHRVKKNTSVDRLNSQDLYQKSHSK